MKKAFEVSPHEMTGFERAFSEPVIFYCFRRNGDSERMKTNETEVAHNGKTEKPAAGFITKKIH